MSDTLTLPEPRPLPAGLDDPLRKKSYALYLYLLMSLFKPAEAPGWLIDAVYDIAFDPDIQALFDDLAARAGDGA